MKYNETSPEANINEQFNKVYESKKMPTNRRLELDALIKQKINKSVRKESFEDDVHSHQTYQKEPSQSLFDKVVDYWSEIFTGNAFKSVALLGGSSFAMLIMVLVVGYYLFDSNSIDDFDYSKSPVYIQATESTALGASQDTRFIISAEATIDTKEIEKSIIIEPVFAYSLKESGGNIEIVPEEELYQETNYSITIPKDTMIGGVMLEEDFVWEFVTEPKFAITDFAFENSYDDEGKIKSSNLIFTSNFDDVDLDSFSDRFYIMPYIKIKEIKQIDKKIIITSEYPLMLNYNYQIAIDKGVKRGNGELMDVAYLIDFDTSVDSEIDDKDIDITFMDQQNSMIHHAVNNSGNMQIRINDADFTAKIGQVTIFHVEDFSDNEDILNLFKKSQYFDLFDMIPYDTLNLHDEYRFADLTYEINDEGVTDVVFEYSNLQKGELYVVRIWYKGDFTYRYIMHSDILGHVTELKDELIVVGFDENGNLLHDIDAKLYYRTNDNEYTIMDIELDGQTTIDTSNIQTALALAIIADDDKSLVMLTQDEQSTVVDSSTLDIFSKSYQDDLLVYTKFDKPHYQAGDIVRFKSIFKITEDLLTFDTFDVNGVEYEMSLDGQNTEMYTPVVVNLEHSYIAGEFVLPEDIDVDSFEMKLVFKKEGIEIGFAEYKVYESDDLSDGLPTPDNSDVDDPVTDIYDRDGNLLYRIYPDEINTEEIESVQESDDIVIDLQKNFYIVGDTLDIEIIAKDFNVIDSRPVVVSLVKDTVLVSHTTTLDKLSQTVSFDLGQDAPPISYVSVVYAELDEVSGSMRAVNLQDKIIVRQSEKEITLNTNIIHADYELDSNDNLMIEATDFEGNPIVNQSVTIRIFDKAMFNGTSVSEYNLYQEVYKSFNPNINYAYSPVYQSTNYSDGEIIDFEYINNGYASAQSGYFIVDLVTDKNGEVITELQLPSGDIQWIIDVEMITDDFSVGNGSLVYGR